MRPTLAGAGLTSDKGAAIVRWTPIGAVWSNGTQFVIRRTNLTTGGTTDVTLTKTQFESGTYTDNLVMMCNQYSYTLILTPNANYSPISEVSTDVIAPTSVGSINTVSVSKGYFSDRIQINWSTDDAFDEFSIQRKLDDTPDSTYVQVGVMSGSSVQASYLFTDATAPPGVVYRYQIVGLIKCAGNRMTSENPPSDIGFRTPTGDIYGRITFENGQAVENVEVNVVTEEEILSKSLSFASGTAVVSVSDSTLLKNNTDSVTLQAWISPNATGGTQKIISKNGMYELGIRNDSIYFKAGDTTMTTDTLSVAAVKGKNPFMHLTGVKNGHLLSIYVNGRLIKEATMSGSVVGNNSPVQFGGGFTGIIDEVRIWRSALSAAVIERDYRRYLTGGERNLLAYYTFNYIASTDFYDISYVGTEYNKNHGTIPATGVTAADIVPHRDQLGYKGLTSADGSYSVRAIPYHGNGTPYQIVPHLGIHTFESAQEVRNISVESQSHTVNFIDKSSFKVTGWVTYKNSTVPVAGVSFNVDGRTVLKSNGIPEETDASGRFEIRVPVGTHEVKATKAQHVFVNDGRITNQFGMDLNYQDEVLGVELEDSTVIKYIGRVAGGVVQEDFPIGHSLSTNNLADGITVELTYSDNRYVFDHRSVVETHFKPSNKNFAYVNQVEYGKSPTPNVITIHVNDTTGEFVAHVIPESFTVSVNAGSMHLDIPGSNSTLDLTAKLFEDSEVYVHGDSVLNADGVKIYREYSDTVYFHAGQKFIKRYRPQVGITQFGTSLPYFGSDSTTVSTLVSDTIVPLYKPDTHTYTFGRPVFIHFQQYTFKAEIFEKYVHYDIDGNETGSVDKVPTQDAKIEFNNGLADEEVTLEADSTGVVCYTFQVGEPEFSSGARSISATITYGDAGQETPIPWMYPESFPDGLGFILGSHVTGTDFVTQGPDKLLTILRDPPGSSSYAYLEKGVTFKETTNFSMTHSASEKTEGTFGIEAAVITWQGVGAGAVNTISASTSAGTVSANGTEGKQSSNSQTTTLSVTDRFETGKTPLYVGASADVYIGYSTNLTFGTTEAVSVVSKERYDADPGAYEAVYALSDEWVLVKTEGKSIENSFATMFSYPQAHIEYELLPQLQAIRDGLLLQPGEVTEEQLQALANRDETPYYVSHWPRDSEYFGKSNIDSIWNNVTNVPGYNPDIPSDGKSYRIFLPDNGKPYPDTILCINQSIQRWIDQMAKNERAKVEATLLIQNYSFSGGAAVSHSEAYISSEQEGESFVWTASAGASTSQSFTIMGVKNVVAVGAGYVTSGSDGSSSEELNSHSKGFLLSEDAVLSEDIHDYLSVSVYHEPGWTEEQEGEEKANEYYGSYIFRTEGGATSCPYEDEYVTKYYEPGMHVINKATMQIEVPGIDMPVKFIENVPSGETAKLEIYLRNNSESQGSRVYTLQERDGSNPHGAHFLIDGSAIGSGRNIYVAAGSTVIKTLEVGKGSVMNYDDLQLIFRSQCQYNPEIKFIDLIADTVTFNVHFIPSCTKVNIKKPGNNWIYNTRLPQMKVNGLDKHYMDVVMDGFDVNYDNFNRLELQYKSASQSDEEWITLMNYYNDTTLYHQAVENGLNAEMIVVSSAGTMTYRFLMDDLPDQRYDLRAVGVCVVNNEEVRNESEVRSGLKDMYVPRLFGSAQPADGILGVEDEVRLNFNEPIADGLLTRNNFTVQGVRNGSVTDHSASIRLDGLSDCLETEFEKSFAEKDITVEMWIQPDRPQNATLFSHGNTNESLELAMTADSALCVRIGNTTLTGTQPVPYDQGTWAHVALVYEAEEGYLTAYYNYEPAIDRQLVGGYHGTGNVLVGKSIHSPGSAPYSGRMHNLRVWEKPLSSTDLQLNSLVQLSGIEPGLVGYYPMNEGKGTVANDKARGATLLMNGCQWSLPEGFSVATGDTTYLQMSTTGAITKAMDFTIEFWFKGAPQTNASLLSNGRGDGNEYGGSAYLFDIGFDENGALAFTGNGEKTPVRNGNNYLDNQWHHFAISVDRTIGRGQICMDGKLNTYIDAAGIGGISSDSIYLGARKWYDETDSARVDNHFTGHFDDIRVWQLYKSERLIAENNNVKLSGKELGLMHYYPFDTYIESSGLEFLNFTGEDMHVSSGANPETDALSVNGGTEETVQSTDIAPLKDAGPVADLEFDFVVNNDALIINLKEQEYRVAKTIVSFTVDDVRDKNGNSIASPITWSAYIDRNQLKWSDDRLNLTKKVYDGLEFTARVVNSGGSMQHYTIGNIPAWLDVTPSEGTVKPSSYEEITFSVNEGLNVGAYNEVIYLTNEDNVSEALTLNLTVAGEKPDWTVNPAEYEYRMSIFGQMRFNNIFSTDKEDMLAAFDNGDCVGVANSTYIKSLDMWYTLLTVYNHIQRYDNLEFRMWDSGTGKIYSAVPSMPVPFYNDTVYGDAEEPVIFDGQEIFYRNISLAKGWNWISFNLANSNLHNLTETLRNGKWTSRDEVKGKINFDTYVVKSQAWEGTLTLNGGLNNTSMYMLSASNAQILSVSGTAINPKQMPIPVLGKQWNYIGYLPPVNITVKDALAGYDAQRGDIVKSQNRFALFSKNEWIGDLTYMEADKGYMLYRSVADTIEFVYPSVSGSLTGLRSAAADNAQDDKYLNTRFSDNMNVVATAAGLQPGDRILAYINDELRGVGEYVAGGDQALSFITVSGNENRAAIRLDWQRNDETIGTTTAPFSYLSHLLIGTPEEPVVLNFGTNVRHSSAYPNPFRKELKIDVDAKAGAPIEVKVIDVAGRIVWTQSATASTDGIHTLVVDGAALEAGIYIVKVTIDGHTATHVVEKITN
jgi:hypothetical protein